MTNQHMRYIFGNIFQFINEDAEAVRNEAIFKVKLAIIDTPINITHEYLRDSEINQGDFVGIDNQFDHGTHVAGIVKQIIANNAGHVEILLSIPVINITIPINSNDHSRSDIEIHFCSSGKVLSGIGKLCQALHGFLNSDCKVANLSCSIRSTNPEVISFITPVLKKLRMKGCILVVAAGNDGIDLDVHNDNDLLLWFQNYEFCAEVDGETKTFKMDNIIFVAASNQIGDRSHFSNFGKKSVALYAPGEDVLSSTTLPNGFDQKSGTGQAAPKVAATLAMMASRFSEASHDQLIQRLLQAADIDNNGECHLNIQRALETN